MIAAWSRSRLFFLVFVGLLAVTEARAAEPAAQPPTAVVSGLGSATFGMTEDQVIAAVQKDFKVARGDIQTGRNPVEQTGMVSVIVPDPIPNTGKARITYILGFKSRTLVQVNVGWGQAAGLPSTPDQILNAGRSLKAALLKSGFDPQKRVVDTPMADGSVVLFRGVTSTGQMTVLSLVGPIREDGGKKVMTPNALFLANILNPVQPDIAPPAKAP